MLDVLLFALYMEMKQCLCSIINFSYYLSLPFTSKSSFMVEKSIFEIKENTKQNETRKRRMCLLKGMIETNKPSKLRLGKNRGKRQTRTFYNYIVTYFLKLDKLAYHFTTGTWECSLCFRAVRGSTFETCLLVNHA